MRGMPKRKPTAAPLTRHATAHSSGAGADRPACQTTRAKPTRQARDEATKTTRRSLPFPDPSDSAEPPVNQLNRRAMTSSTVAVQGGRSRHDLPAPAGGGSAPNEAG